MLNYSMVITLTDPQKIKRMETEANIWLASARPDGRPHLTPVWFAWFKGEIYICIQAKSVKATNIKANPQVALSLEDGSSVVIAEGVAEAVSTPWPQAVADIFFNKYQWNIYTDEDYDLLLKIRPAKWLGW